ncbi:actin cortical patch SUR7/pH-response regulator pali [Aspergillus pseudoustus]|uniref:Actin cortical patch SUR7/pH-response regulator pali n=1 Tax=Aspergillus pseudoustus TaxID=1810923 RepID=A0ABR4K4K4_9EURO
MGRIRRLLCISAPYALSTASLLCLVFTGIGCTGTSPPESKLYFMKANVTGFGGVIENTLASFITRRSLLESSINSVTDLSPNVESAVDVIGELSQDVHNATASSVTSSVEGLMDDMSNTLTSTIRSFPDFYTIGLWSYCEGRRDSSGQSSTNCTTPRASFWFNFTEVLGLQNSWVEEVFPDKFNTAMHVYKSASAGISVFYIAAVASSVLTLLCGVAATLSRWGSSLISICAVASALCNVVWSGLATGVYATLVGILRLVFDPHGNGATMGTSMLAASWLATLFSLLACPFWVLSSCCCSRRS